MLVFEATAQPPSQLLLNPGLAPSQLELQEKLVPGLP